MIDFAFDGICMVEEDINNVGINESEVLSFHSAPPAGKLAVLPTKPILTKRDLSLAYSPGVAIPCIKIAENKDLVYSYTAKGNLVGIISNGTAVLGLGNIGAAASKPVMEGKAVLFKRFADIDAFDVEVDAEDIDTFIKVVSKLGVTWGGINLEDIKAPECFIIEEKLIELMDIPVFHDDQHGTAIIVAAGIINSADIVGKKLSDLKIVINGAGAAGIACRKILAQIGVLGENIIMCDQTGVIYTGRSHGMNKWKEIYSVDTSARTLADALHGADVFIGLSVKDILNEEMLKSMNSSPIIFALANPDPEVNPAFAKAVRSDAIIATGRSDYINQVNNVMCFPYVFRGALDVRASVINDEMKLAAVHAIADLARKQNDDFYLSHAKHGSYGKDYVIPSPFDPRLVIEVSSAVAKAAIDSGVAAVKIDHATYKAKLYSRFYDSSSTLSVLFGTTPVSQSSKKTLIFSEGEEKTAISAAVQWRDAGYGSVILVGKEDRVRASAAGVGAEDFTNISIVNASTSKNNEKYIDYLYSKVQRKGHLYRSCVRSVKTDRNIFASCMLACGEGDILITGLTRGYMSSLTDISSVIDRSEVVFGLSMILAENRLVFIADSAINELLNAVQMSNIAISAAKKVRLLGHEPRVAFVSFSNFGSNENRFSKQIHEAIKILDSKSVDFEYDGEMSAGVALNSKLMSLYPFSKLSGPANIIITPGAHSACIATQILQELGGCNVIGPILFGLEYPVQIVSMTASASDIINIAMVGATLANN